MDDQVIYLYTAHEAVIRTTQSDRLIGHIAHDGSAISARKRIAKSNRKKAVSDEALSG